MPGTIPATSQLDRLISMTAINVLAGSRAMRDRLKLFNVCMGSSIGSQRTMDAISTPPHSIFHHGIRSEVEQSLARPCRRGNGRFKRTYELTSSIVPRGQTPHRLRDRSARPHDPRRNVEWLLSHLPQGRPLEVDIVCHSRGARRPHPRRAPVPVRIRRLEHLRAPHSSWLYRTTAPQSRTLTIW